MEGIPFVLEISSDEELCLEEGEGLTSIDYDEWITECMSMHDEELVVSEVKKTEHKSKSSISTPAEKDMDDDDDDDDCMILDGDPEKLDTSVEEAPADSDELLVVGEKGQVACRDYPHPGHFCANFPFSSSPHERHCEQCHCYVCDSLAPCLKWGTGFSSTDHCHATDKSEMWKTLRTNFKLGKTAPIPASTNYGTSCDVGNLLHKHKLPLDIPQFSPRSPLLNQTWSPMAARTCSSVNLKPQNQPSRPIIMCTSSSRNSSILNQVSRPTTIPLCSTTNFTIPHDANHGRCHESASSLGRNRYQSPSVLKQLLGVRYHAIQRMRGRGAVSLGPQFLHSSMMSEGVGSAGSTLPTNYSSHGSFGLNNHVSSAQAQQYDRYHPATRFSSCGTLYGQNDVWVPSVVLYTQPSSGRATLSRVNKNTVGNESQAYYQSNDSQNFYRSCIQDNDASSSYVAHLNRNQHLNEHQIGSQNENAHGNIIKCGITRQDACQQKPHKESQSEYPSKENQSESAIKEDFSASDSSWTENACQNISYLQSSRSVNQPPDIKESGTQFTGRINLGSVDDVKNLLFDEDGFVPVVENGALGSELNITSPYLSPIDTGMFLFDCDFDNS